MPKYKSATNHFCNYVDLPVGDIYRIVKEESTELERSDLKAIVMELCTRILNAKAMAG